MQDYSNEVRETSSGEAKPAENGAKPAESEVKPVEQESLGGPQGETPDEPTESLKARISALEAELAEERRQKEHYLAGWQRTQADFENYRKRLEQERGDMIRSITDAALASFLPVLDNLDTAFGFVGEGDKDNPVVKGVVKGIEIIKKQVAEFVERQGLRAIESVGKPFDPKFHEAIQQVVDDSVEEGTVVREVRKGYISHDRVLRPSLVMVSRRSQAEEEKPQAEEDR